jgi:hypothetical protein
MAIASGAFQITGNSNSGTTTKWPVIRMVK